MGRSSRAAKGFLTSVLRYAAQILVQVLLAPVVLKYAGRETLGAYAAIMQVLGLIALVDIVGSWSLERFLGQAIGLDDGGRRFREILTTARTVFLFCNAVFALLVVIFSLFMGHLLHLSPDVALQARLALYVIAGWAVLRTPLAAYNNASVATQDLAAVNLIGTLLGIVRAVASLAFVMLGGGLFGLMLAGTAAEASGYFLFRIRFKKMNPTLMPGWGFKDKALLKELVSFGAHAGLINVGSALIFRSGNMISGMASGAVLASNYYTTQLPGMTIYNIVKGLSESANPAVNELWGRGEHDKVRSTLIRLTRLVMTLTLPLATGILLFNRDVIVTWVGAQQYAGVLFTVSLTAFCVISSIRYTAIDYSVVFGWMPLLTVTTIMQGVANIGLGFVLDRYLGLGGIMLALALVVIPQTVLLWRKVGGLLNLNVLSMYGVYFRSAALPLLAASIAGWGLIRPLVHIRLHSILPLATELAVFLLVYSALAYPLMLTDQDRTEIRHYARRIFHTGRRTGQKLFGNSEL